MVKLPVQIEAPAQAEQEIVILVERLENLQDEVMVVKETLKEFRVQSDVLSDLKASQKAILDSIVEEKERIIEGLEENPDYLHAKKQEIEIKNKMKETATDLRVALENKHAPAKKKLFKDEMTTKNGQLSLFLEYAPVVYINGKAIKI